MQFYLAREEGKRNGLIWKFGVGNEEYNFMLCNPLHVLELPRKLHWWVNIIPGKIWDHDLNHIHYWGHVISLFYSIYVPVRKND